jgi:propionyl-CoA carboxylase alpha chain
VRNDTGVYEGGEISIWYDPMIAKLVTHAGDRATAIEAQARALDAFVIDGIRHNIAFLSALMQHPRWKSGALSTGFIAEEFPNGFAPLTAEGEKAHVLAAVAAAIERHHDYIVGEVLALSLSAAPSPAGEVFEQFEVGEGEALIALKRA